MAVVIGEIVTETVADAGAGSGGESAAGAGAASGEQFDAVVRRATERVLETLRMEWDR